MLRRQARLRREYLYRKSVEDRERTILEKKRKLEDAMEDLAATTHKDDEYVWARVENPKIVVTTSHNPSSRLKQFAKELRLIFPNAQRLNCGNYVMDQLVDACRANNVTDLIIVHEHRGEPVYEIRLGTVDQTDVDVEWRLRPYMNTARRRFTLSTDHT